MSVGKMNKSGGLACVNSAAAVLGRIIFRRINSWSAFRNIVTEFMQMGLLQFSTKALREKENFDLGCP